MYVPFLMAIPASYACGAAEFTLPAEDVPGQLITHLGSALTTIDDIKDQVEPVDHEDKDLEDAVGTDFVQKFHFGGGKDETSAARTGAVRKSKKEVMAEVIARSKLAKAEKRQQKDDDESSLAQLDQRFAALQEVCTALR